MNIIDKLNRHPVIFALMLAGSIASIYALVLDGESHNQTSGDGHQVSPKVVCDANSSYKVEVAARGEESIDLEVASAVRDYLSGQCYQLKMDMPGMVEHDLYIMHSPDARL